MNLDIWKLLAGLFLFLLAMSLLEEAIRAFAGNRMKAMITRGTQSPVLGILTGTVATALLQSSSLVGLLVLAFVGAKIMKLKNALLIIFGANLGTTATGWIVTLIGFKLDLGAASYPLIAVGGFIWVIAGQKRANHYGRCILAIGVLLLALEFMKSAIAGAETLVSPEFLADLSPWQFLLFGVVFTACVQSSSAAMVITLSALNSGILDLYDAAAVMIGADLGTTTTVILGALRGSADKKRVALGHVIFNVITDTFAFLLLIPLVSFVAALDDPLFSLVAFHSLFNMLGVCLCTPFVGRVAAFLEARFRKPDPTVLTSLDASLLAVPEAAVAALFKESKNLAGCVTSQNASLFRITDRDMPSKSVYKQSYVQAKHLEAEILDFSLDLDLRDSDHAIRRDVERFLSASRSLLLSSKLCKDNMTDLRELADYQPDLFDAIIDAQVRFYDKFMEAGDVYGSLDLEQIDSFIAVANEIHDQIHEKIYALIKRDEIPLKKISTVLNVNRAIFNSNLALLSGLATLAGTSDQLRLAA